MVPHPDTRSEFQEFTFNVACEIVIAFSFPYKLTLTS